jgi:hypothetical protein
MDKFYLNFKVILLKIKKIYALKNKTLLLEIIIIGFFIKRNFIF